MPTTTEFLLYLVLAAAVTPILSSATNTSNQQLHDSQVADYTKIVNTAAAQYLSSNQSVIMTAVSGGTPVAYTMTTLQTAGYLPSGISTVNSNYQTECLIAAKTSATTFAAIVVSENNGANAHLYNDGDARQIAQDIGGTGGFVNDANTTIQGIGGNWSFPTATFNSASCSGTKFGVGSIVSYINYNTSAGSDNALYRNYIPGRYDLNTTSTPIKLGPTVVEATSDTKCVNTNASAKGLLAEDASGHIMECNGTVWQSHGGYFKDPIATYAALSALTVNNTVGDVRFTADKHLGFMWDGLAWDAIGVDNSGNLTVPNILTVNTVTASGNVTATGNVSGNTLVANLVAVSGASCATYGSGALAKDATGLPLSCQSGSWEYTNQSNVQFFNFNGVIGTWDIGWHRFCAIAEYDTAQSTVVHTNTTSGPDQRGYYDWDFGVSVGVTWGSSVYCLN